VRVLWIGPDGVEEGTAADISSWRRREGGLMWVDLPGCDVGIFDLFDVHPLAVRDCVEGNRVPKVRTYADHLFVVLHGAGAAELDVFIGFSHLITLNGGTEGVLARVIDGRLRPRTAAEVAHAIVSTLAAGLEATVAQLARSVADLEQRILGGDVGDPEDALEEMFRLRHELLGARTVAAEDREVMIRMASLARFLPEESRPFIDDLVDRFERVRSLADGEKELLQGVIDFQESRTATKMNIAMERLALIAAVVLPINALAGIYGMNVIVNSSTDPIHVVAVIAVMLAVSGTMLVWARRHGWW
jgi:magnesium transporter